MAQEMPLRCIIHRRASAIAENSMVRNEVQMEALYPRTSLTAIPDLAACNRLGLWVCSCVPFQCPFLPLGSLVLFS